jgi:hypothetical protein
MALVFPRNKRNATPGAEGRLDPVDAGKATGAETLLPFVQKGPTAITLGRQKKLEESLKK